MVAKKIRSEINILLMMDQLYCSIAGTEQHVSFLMHNLPSINCHVHLALLRDSGYYDLNYYPAEPFMLNFQTFKSVPSLREAVQRLKDIILKYKIDIIYTFFPDSEIIAGLAVRNSKKCIQIAARRNLGHGHDFVSLWRTRLTNKFIPNYIANCDAVKNRISELEYISEQKIEVIRNPINRTRMTKNPKPNIAKQELGLSDGTLVVGIVATLSVVKDHESFFLCAKIIIESIPQIKFIVVGRVEQAREIKLHDLVEKLGIQKYVVFAGEHENPVPLMETFDVGVLCSKSEGFSNTLLEYAAVGMPIVATDVGGNSDIVVHEKNGYLVPPSSPDLLAKAIIELLSDARVRKEFAKAGKERVNMEFAQENVLERYRTYFERILQNVPNRNE